MELSQAPTFGDFSFIYKSVCISVPVSLNDVARHKPNTFWDWLLFKHPFDSHIELRVEHLIEESQV
jgi:hypothetical protein